LPAQGVEQRGEGQEARGVEDVARHAKLLGDGEGGGAEHVGQKGRDAGGGAEEGAEEVLEVREHAPDNGDDAGHDVHVGGEVVEGHLREGGSREPWWEGSQRGGVGGRGEVGIGDNRGGGAVNCGEVCGELGHRGDVPHARGPGLVSKTTCGACTCAIMLGK
jgi:hypothetical protein